MIVKDANTKRVIEDKLEIKWVLSMNLRFSHPHHLVDKDQRRFSLPGLICPRSEWFCVVLECVCSVYLSLCCVLILDLVQLCNFSTTCLFYVTP